MALRDQPYLPLYVQDFLTDEKLVECSASATGIYIRLMCVMHKSEPYGMILLKQKDKQSENICLNFAYKLARHLPYSIDEISAGIEELLSEGVLMLENNKLIQRRMVKDNELSEKRAVAGKKGGTRTQQFAKAKVEANTEDENISYVLLFNKVIKENDINLSEEFKELILVWLKYKSEKRQTYKETGLKSLLIKVMNDTGGDVEELRSMILYSTSKNYDGLFKEKNNAGYQKDNGATPDEIAAIVAGKFASDRA